MIKVKPKLTPIQLERAAEAMNVIYLCSEIQNMAWMINKDLNLGDPNLNNFNKRIGRDAKAIQTSLGCKPKNVEMVEDRAIELYRSLNFLAQYNTEELRDFNDRVEEEYQNQIKVA